MLNTVIMLNTINIKINNDTALPIEPDIIMNRYDLQQAYGYLDLLIESKVEQKRVLVRINKITAYVGCYLMDLSVEELRALVSFLFAYSRRIQRVKYIDSLIWLGAYKENAQRYIDLPDSSEELINRLSRKSRYNLRREKRLVRENIDEYDLVHYFTEDTPDDVMEFYFSAKREIYNRDFHMSGKEYLTKHYVTDVYVMRTNTEILAVAFSCEQCGCPYFENFAFNTKYSKYSLGALIYNMYLCELIKKGTKRVYLGSDQYEYKKHYKSVRVLAYIGEIYRYSIITKAVSIAKSVYRYLWYHYKEIREHL